MLIDSPYEETMKGYLITYHKDSYENIIQFGKAIEKSFKVKMQDDETRLFIADGLCYIIDNILTNATNQLKGSLVTDKDVSEIIKGDVMQELLVDRPFRISEMNFDLVKYSKINMYLFVGYSTSNAEPSETKVRMRDYRYNLFKLQVKELITLAYNMNLGTLPNLREMKKVELQDLVLPYMPIVIKKASVKKIKN